MVSSHERYVSNQGKKVLKSFHGFQSIRFLLSQLDWLVRKHKHGTHIERKHESSYSQDKYSTCCSRLSRAGSMYHLGCQALKITTFVFSAENETAYVTVFIFSALGAALVMIGVVVCFVTAGKKKEFIKLDVMHRPKRYIALPKATKKSNQNGQGPAKEEKGLDDCDRSVQRKGPEVVFTAQDVSNQVKKEFSIDRCEKKKKKKNFVFAKYGLKCQYVQ